MIQGCTSVQMYSGPRLPNKEIVNIQVQPPADRETGAQIHFFEGTHPEPPNEIPPGVCMYSNGTRLNSLMAHTLKARPGIITVWARNLSPIKVVRGATGAGGPVSLVGTELMYKSYWTNDWKMIEIDVKAGCDYKVTQGRKAFDFDSVLRRHIMTRTEFVTVTEYERRFFRGMGRVIAQEEMSCVKHLWDQAHYPYRWFVGDEYPGVSWFVKQAYKGNDTEEELSEALKQLNMKSTD